MASRELYKEIDFKKNLKLYFELAKPYKWLFLGVIFLAVIIESARIFEKFLFKIILDNGTDFVAGILIESAFVRILLIVGGVFISVLIVKVVSHWFQVTLINRLEGGMMKNMKTRFFNHIVHLDHNFHTTHKTGSMISKMTRGSSAVESLSDFFIYNIVPLILQVVIIGGTLFYFDKLAALVIIVTSVLFVGYGIFISHIQKKPHVEAFTAEDTEKARMADIFVNIDSIKYFGKENFIKKRFEKLTLNSLKKRVAFWDYGRYFSMGQSLILGIGTFFIIYFPLLKFLNGEMTIGTLAFIYTVYVSLMGPLFGFVHGIRRFYISLGDFDSLFRYEESKNEIKEKAGAKKLEIKKGEIEFRDITFGYHEKRNRAINGLSLKIKPNEKIALVGRSGCGKTTLVKLLYRFYDVNSGGIFIDGKDIRDIKQESLRGELSIVPQEVILFDDTLFNNIAFSKPGATKSEVMKAIKFAQLDLFVKDLPLKENTIVGERGVKLSGGEKQRVSIARAILADKKVLVLDEATSALDSETEYDIQRDLEKLMEGRTSIIIAHRLSTIMKADKIIVMEKGKIVQFGKHYDLIGQAGQYKKLWNLQKGGYLKE
jgi:ATP-binding cassette, subfamily B, heavy metal transporter